MTNMIRRMFRAALLDWKIYEELEADTSALYQALGVVLLSSFAAAIGSSTGLSALPLSIITHVLVWFIWAALTYWIGTRILPEATTRADLGELLRTIGFAASPGLIRVLGIVPDLRAYIFWAAAVWMLLAVVVAVRQALDYSSTARAVLVCLIGWLIQILFLLLATTRVR